MITNWRELYRNHMEQLRQMVNDKGPQWAEAERLLIKAETEYKEMDEAVTKHTAARRFIDTHFQIVNIRGPQ